MIKIIWTPKAKSDFNNILEYLHQNWGIHEVENFIHQTDSMLAEIANHPQMFIESTKKKGVFRGLVTRHNSLFYKLNPH